MGSNKRKSVSVDEYRAEAKGSAEVLQKQGYKLTEVSRFLNVAPDYSPANIELMRTALQDMKEVAITIKRVLDVSISRGVTYHNEAKEKLLTGGSRFVRAKEDNADMAAE